MLKRLSVITILLLFILLFSSCKVQNSQNFLRSYYDISDHKLIINSSEDLQKIKDSLKDSPIECKMIKSWLDVGGDGDSYPIEFYTSISKLESCMH